MGTARELRLLVREAGTAIEKLRAVPRGVTAPLVRFREACRLSYGALRMIARAERKLASARRRLDPPPPGDPPSS